MSMTIVTTICVCLGDGVGMLALRTRFSSPKMDATSASAMILVDSTVSRYASGPSRWCSSRSHTW